MAKGLTLVAPLAALVALLPVLPVACSSTETASPGLDSGSDGASGANVDVASGEDAFLGEEAAVEASGSQEGGDESEGTGEAAAGDGAAGEAAASDGAAGEAAASDAGPADADAQACSVTEVYVDVARGLDTNAGTELSPYQTITKAIGEASGNACIATVHVAAGTYDAVHGEIFPLVLPANLALVGDEPNKGNSADAGVFIHGSGHTTSNDWLAVIPGSGAIVAGFAITAPFPADASSAAPTGVLLTSSTTNVTIRNCTLSGNSESGVFISNSKNAAVIGNVVTGNGIGLYLGGSSSAKFEDNVITKNIYGVEFDTGGGDLGGGAFASAGRNTLSCNTTNDLWTTAGSVFAENDAWDHVPPTTTVTDGGKPDIFSAGSPAPNTGGATLASSPCP